jgi:aminoglycoside phosphotransferase (APT) family kinase protein
VDVDAALSGRAGDAGIRDLLLGDGRTALREVLSSMLGDGGPPGPCRLRRAHLKPARRMSASYDVTVRGGAHAVPVAVTWYRGGSVTGTDGLDATEEALRRAGVRSPFGRLWAPRPSWAMLVLAAPLDPAFPRLAHLSDPRRAAYALVGCGVLSTAPAGGVEVRPVRYRPGQRHVLEYRLPHESLFVKLYRPGAGGAVAEAVATFAALVEAAPVTGMRAVRPVAALGGGDALLYRRAAGTSLSQRLRARRPPGAAHAQQIGHLMRAVHSAVPPPGSALPLRELDGEARVTVRACEAMTALRPDLGALAAGIVERARERLERLEQEPPTVVHGDMKADHMLWGREGLTVLDTDRCSLADPAFDLGKMLADLRWWSAATRQPDAAGVEAQMLAAYGAARPRLARAELHAAMLLVRMAARRVSLAAPDWASRTAGLLAAAGRAVEVRAAA